MGIDPHFFCGGSWEISRALNFRIVDSDTQKMLEALYCAPSSGGTQTQPQRAGRSKAEVPEDKRRVWSRKSSRDKTKNRQTIRDIEYLWRIVLYLATRGEHRCSQITQVTCADIPSTITPQPFTQLNIIPTNFLGSFVLICNTLP